MYTCMVVSPSEIYVGSLLLNVGSVDWMSTCVSMGSAFCPSRFSVWGFRLTVRHGF